MSQLRRLAESLSKSQLDQLRLGICVGRVAYGAVAGGLDNRTAGALGVSWNLSEPDSYVAMAWDSGESIDDLLEGRLLASILIRPRSIVRVYPGPPFPQFLAKSDTK